MNINYPNTNLFINGEWIGFINNIFENLKLLKNNRMKCIIHYNISFYMNYIENSLYIYSDRGRCTRPLFKVTNNKLLYNSTINKFIKNNGVKWFDFLINNKDDNNLYCIEYIDIYEVNKQLILTWGETFDKCYTTMKKFTSKFIL